MMFVETGIPRIASTFSGDSLKTSLDEICPRHKISSLRNPHLLNLHKFSYGLAVMLQKLISSLKVTKFGMPPNRDVRYLSKIAGALAISKRSFFYIGKVQKAYLHPLITLNRPIMEFGNAPHLGQSLKYLFVV
ncbi:hypothetical protein RF11_04804 [Thelohanellus kitauei]|uniref:Uncharacterized protein n=1 Tax=Thelohanellus kitauei TaxID=669202 RepID=A0A0C2MZR3_THEKT|nr:hypothetical protein RF11_04804 [Thelohanellus kitauei]